MNFDKLMIKLIKWYVKDEINYIKSDEIGDDELNDLVFLRGLNDEDYENIWDNIDINTDLADTIKETIHDYLYEYKK